MNLNLHLEDQAPSTGTQKSLPGEEGNDCSEKHHLTKEENCKSEQISLTALKDFKINILGKSINISLHFSDKCGLSVKIVGRMIPYEHLRFTMLSYFIRRGEREKIKLEWFCVVSWVVYTRLFACSIFQGFKTMPASVRLTWSYQPPPCRNRKPIACASLGNIHYPIVMSPTKIHDSITK